MKSRVHLVAGLVAAVTAGMLVPAATSSPTAAQDQTSWYVNDNPSLNGPLQYWRAGDEGKGYGPNNYVYTYGTAGESSAENWARWSMGVRVGRQEIQVYVPHTRATATVTYRISIGTSEHTKRVAQRNAYGWTSLGNYDTDGSRVSITLRDNDASQHWSRDGFAASSIGVDAVQMRCISRCSTTSPPPPPVDGRSVSLGLGVDRAGCSDASLPCRWLTADFSGFSRGSYSTRCYWSTSRSRLGTVFATFTTLGLDDPTFCWYNGTPGRYLTAVVDGVRSNTIRFGETGQTTAPPSSPSPPSPSTTITKESSQEGRSVIASVSDSHCTDRNDETGEPVFDESGEPVMYTCRVLAIRPVGFGLTYSLTEEQRSSGNYVEVILPFECYQSDTHDTLGVESDSGNFVLYSSLHVSDNGDQPLDDPGFMICPVDGADGLYLTVVIDGVQSNTVRYSALDGSGLDQSGPSQEGRSVVASLSSDETGVCHDYHDDSDRSVNYPCRELEATLVGFPRELEELRSGASQVVTEGSYTCYQSDHADKLGVIFLSGSFHDGQGHADPSDPLRISLCPFSGADGVYLTVVIDGVQSNSVRFSALDGSGVDRDAPVQVNQNGGTPPPPPPPPPAVPVDPSPAPSGRRVVELSSPRNLRVERADLGATGGAAHDYWIRWDPPSDDGGAQVVRYEGEVTTGYWIFKTTRPFRTNSSPFEFRGRTCTTYSVSVSATNSAGRVSAPATESVDTFCPGAPPGEPRYVKLTVEEHFGNPWLVAHWTPPTEDGGQRVHSYRLEAWPGSGSRPSGSDPIRASTGRTSKRLVKNPEFGATYTVRIAARNRVGTGDWVYKSVVARDCPAGGKHEKKRDGGLFGSHRVYALTAFTLEDNSMVEKGDKGGIVTSGNVNLSQSDCSWISGDDKTQVVDAAIVMDNALVTGGARVQEHAVVSGNAIVNGGDIKIEEHASVSGNARITSKALISDEAKISGNAKVGSGDGGITRVYGKAKISDDAVVSGNARVYGEDSKVYDNAKVSGNARVYGEASVFGNAHVTGNAHVYGSAQVTGRTSCMNNGRLQARLTCWTNDTKLKPAEVTGYAHVYGDAEVSGSARILGNARVSGEAEVTGNALIFGDMEIDSGVYDGTQEHKRAAEELYDMTYNKVREELIEACPNTISRENLHSLTMSLMARGPAPGSLDESTLLGCSQNRVISDMLDALSVSGWELFLEFGLPVVKASSIKRLALIADVLELGLSIRDAVDTRAALDEATKRFSEWGISEQDFKAVNEKVFKEYNALIAKRR